MTLRPMPEQGGAFKPDDIPLLIARNSPGGVATVAMAATLIYLNAQVASLPTSAWRAAWFVFMFASLAGLGVIQIGFCLPSVRARVPARAWVRAMQVATVLMCGGTAISVWLLMPIAHAEFRLVLVIAYFWFAVLNVMVAANRLTITGSAAVLLSLAGFASTQSNTYALPLAGVCVLATISLVVVRGLIWRVAERAAGASRETQEQVRTLEVTIATMAAQHAEILPSVRTEEILRRPSEVQSPDLKSAIHHIDNESLTKRQAQILRLVARGLSNKEIARELQVSPSTIKTHLSQSIAVLRALNRTDAAVKASAIGIL